MKKDEPGCENCGLKDFTYVKPYFATVKQYPILFVGQAPGAVECITQRPFTGPAGKMNWRILHEAGIDQLKVDITNTAKCAPPDDRKPTKDEMLCCSHLLKEDIHRSQPKLIVALGEVATKALTGKAISGRFVSKRRGSFEPLDFLYDYDCLVFCCMHPSFVMRQRQWIPIAIEDMQKAVAYVRGGSIQIVHEEPSIETDFNEYKLAEYLEQASKTACAVDTETTGLNPRQDRVIGASLCFEDNVAIAFDLPNNDPMWYPFTRWLEDPNAKKITQNGQFDLAMLDNHNITVQGLAFDTRLAEHLISSDLPGSLDFLRSKYTQTPPYKPSARELRDIPNWTRDRRLKYGGLDALVTYQVQVKQMQLLDANSLKVMETIEIPLIYVLNAMEKRGVMVDTEELEKLHSTLQPKVDGIVANFFAPIGVNPNSPKQLKEWFGVDGTNEEFLKEYIKRGHECSEQMERLLEYREAKKILSTYVVGVKERLEYGRIHTHYKVGGAGTGRLSSENPNLQNVPIDLRRIYISDPGNQFVEADYSQLEVRVLAVVANEKYMIQEIQAGTNVHHNMGYAIYGRKWDVLTDKEKVYTKNVVFGTAYGRGPHAIARQFGVSVATATEWQTICLKRYPGLRHFHTKMQQVFLSTGKSFTPFGRSRPIQSVTQALNTPIQSSGSDVCLTSLIKLHELGMWLQFTVHDSIAIQAEAKDVKDAAVTMKNVMERSIPEMNNFSFPVKLKTGTNWRDMEELKI